MAAMAVVMVVVREEEEVVVGEGYGGLVGLLQ